MWRYKYNTYSIVQILLTMSGDVDQFKGYVRVPHLCCDMQSPVSLSHPWIFIKMQSQIEFWRLSF